MVVSDRTKGCCSSDLNEPPRPTMTNLLNLTHTTCLAQPRHPSLLANAHRPHEMLGARPMRFKAVRIAARSSAALGGISLNAGGQPLVSRFRERFQNRVFVGLPPVRCRCSNHVGKAR